MYIKKKIKSTLKNTCYKTPLHIAIEKGNIKAVQMLLTNPNINVNIFKKK